MSGGRLENISIQLHTIEGVPKEIPGVLVFSKCGDGQRRFPLCTRRAITDAFFWKSAVLFRWQPDLILEWLVYGYDGKTDIPLGRCRYPLNELLNTRKQAVESKRLKLIDDPSITVCFSAELMPRPVLPDGSVALSVLKLPDFLNEIDSDAPLFNHDRLYEKSTPGVPSIWLGMAKANDSRHYAQEWHTDIRQEAQRMKECPRPPPDHTDGPLYGPAEHHTTHARPATTHAHPTTHTHAPPLYYHQQQQPYAPVAATYYIPASTAPVTPPAAARSTPCSKVYESSIRRPQTFTETVPGLKGMANRIARKIGVLLHRGDSSDDDEDENCGGRKGVMMETAIGPTYAPSKRGSMSQGRGHF